MTTLGQTALDATPVGLDVQMAELRREVEQLRVTLDQVRDGVLAGLELGSREAELETARFDRTVQILDLIRSEDSAMRRLLHDVRRTPDYARAFTDAHPLVSVVIPTYRNWEGLRDHSLPSVLSQTYTNLEVIVVGDCAPPEAKEVVDAARDSRVRYIHDEIRGPYPTDPKMMWCVKGVPPANTAWGAARGQWLSFFADDDAMLPNAVETMLDFVRSGEHEFGYGQVLARKWDGESVLLGSFPPYYGGQAIQGSLLHSSLRFLHLDPGDALFDVPSDWAFTYRLMRLGVRIGYCEKILAEYNWTRPPHAGGEAP